MPLLPLTPSHPLIRLPEDSGKSLAGQVYRFIDGLADGYHPEVDLPLPCQPQASDDASPGVDRRSPPSKIAGTVLEGPAVPEAWQPRVSHSDFLC